MTFSSIKNNYKIKFFIASVLILLFYLLLNYQNHFFKFWFSSKIWAHRVNSIEKFQEAHNKFQGVELDVVFNSDNNYFDVNHPPAKSINLKLFDFLNSKKEYKNFGIWLDYKNLNKSNYLQSASKLDSIIENLNIRREDIIVESQHPLFLEVFTKKGYKTSYYLPSDFSTLAENDLQIQYNLVNKLFDTGKLNYISSDVKDYYLMKKKFPNRKIITWIIDTPDVIKNLYTLKVSLVNFKRNFLVLSDSNVKVVLFTFKANKGNR